MSNFLVYKSSAGSGKTYTLVKEYLKIVIRDPASVQGILAITFTNAAASEMKDRVIASLGDLSALSGKPSDGRDEKAMNLLKTLAAETGLTGSEIIKNATKALSFILHNYSQFSISTIDSFASKVIRSFAFDLHLPLNFDVELDRDQMLTQAIDLLINRAGQFEEKALTRLLVDYIETRTDEDKNHFIESDMAQLAQSIMDEKGSLYIERLRNITLTDFGNIHKKLTDSIKRFEGAITEKAEEARLLIERHGITDEMFYQGKKGLGSYFLNLAIGSVAEKITPNSFVLDTINNNRWTSTKTTSADKALIEQVSAELTRLFHLIQQLSAESLLHYKEFRLIRRHLFPMAVLCELERVIDQLKSENSVLHISDFNRKISEIVAEEPAPFIYERIGEKYQHYMIDEFQDTSVLQWQNLLPLIDNALATSKINLVVGDGKQAIYRWRNGDVEQFASLPLLPGSVKAKNKQFWEETLKRNYLGINLDTNWRSLPEVVGFNNRFFRFASQNLPPALAPVYQDLEQKAPPGKMGGFVEVRFIESADRRKTEYQENTLDAIVEIITDLCNTGYSLYEITILCRANSEASTIARHLLEKKINVISSESLLLSQSQKVNFILSAMMIIGYGAQKVPVTEFIGFLARSHPSAIDLHKVISQVIPHGAKKQDIRTEIQIEQWLHGIGISFSFSASRHLGLYDLAETIVRTFFNEGKTDPYIAFFLDVIWEYTNRFVSSVSGFLEWWEEKSGKYSVVVPEGVDAVQVMTIHKSKGLQFPVVICPFTDKDFSKPAREGEWVELPERDETSPLQTAWFTLSKAMEGTSYEHIWETEMGKTLLDALNIAYVAFTRPVEKLFILSRFPASGKFTGNNLAGFLKMFLEGEQLWDENLRTFTFGKNSMRNTSNQKLSVVPEGDNFLDEFVNTSWGNRILIHSKRMEIGKFISDATSRGRLIHHIMQRIKTPGDVPEVLENLPDTHLTKEDKDVLNEKLQVLLANPLIKPYFQDGIKVLNECGMYDHNGTYYRADRVILDNNDAVIIDYKTGKIIFEHANQLRQYAAIIARMGYNIKGKILVYLDQGLVEEVI